MKKIKTLLALVIATSLALVGCGQKAAEEPKKEEENPFEKVAALYEEQINGHEEIGVAGAGGFRADVVASNKKDGLLLNHGSGMNGQFEIARINLDIKEDGTIALKNTTLQEYILGDAVERETEGEGQIITWYAIYDLSALEQFKAGKLDLNKEPEENAESQPKEETELVHTQTRLK